MTSDVSAPGPQRKPRPSTPRTPRTSTPSLPPSNGPSLGRRQFLTMAGAGIAASTVITTVKVATGGFTNTPPRGYRVIPVNDPIDNTTQAKTSHLGSTWVRQTVIPKSGKVLDEFELAFEMRSFLKDITGAGGIGAQLNMRFITEPDSTKFAPQWVDIIPSSGGLNSGSYIDPTKPGEYSNWTISDLFESYDPTMTFDANSGLVLVNAKRKNGGYELVIAWNEVHEDYTSTGTSKTMITPRIEVFQLPIKSIYGVAPAVEDARDLRDATGVPLFNFQSGIHHLNKVNSFVALTKLTTSNGQAFEPADVVIERSGTMYEATIGGGQDNKDYRLLWVEPSASNIGFENNIAIGPVNDQYSPDQDRTIVKDNEGNRISTFIGRPTDLPSSIKRIETSRYNPYAIRIDLGEFNAFKDFVNTIALVEGTRTVTWVAPTINALGRVSDILNSVDLVNQNIDGYPIVQRGTSSAHFTPIELAVGLADLSSLKITLYQELEVATTSGDEYPNYETTARIEIFGDDLFIGNIDLPRDFDLSKPIKCVALPITLDDIQRVPERYPVIDPLTPVVCYPPQDLR